MFFRRLCFAAVFFLGFAATALPLKAHLHPVYPVRVCVKADSGQIRVFVKVKAGVWEHDILGQKPPSGPWPREIREKAHSYLAKHLRLSLNGTPLEGRLAGIRYTRNPWDTSESAQLSFRLIYPVENPAGLLKLKSDFYGEIKEEVLKEGVSIPEGHPWRFETHLWGLGKKRILTPAQPEVEMNWAGIQRGWAQVKGESFRWGVFQVLKGPFPFVLVFLLALFYGMSFRSAWKPFLIWVGFFAGGFFCPWSFFPNPLAALWAGAFAAALVLKFWPLKGKGLPAQGAAALGSGLGFSLYSQGVLAQGDFLLFSPASFLLGSLAGVAVTAFVSALLFWLYRRPSAPMDRENRALLLGYHRSLAVWGVLILAGSLVIHYWS